VRRAARHIAAKVFGYATFGRVYGTIICLSGVVNFAQPVIDSIRSNVCRGDPVPVNIALGAVGTVLAVVFTAFVANKTRNMHKRASCWERSRLLANTNEYGTMA
jgi:hypothetical protein